MDQLSLQQANTIIESTFAHARRLSLAPLTVVVLDAAGYPVAMQRQDGSSLLRPQIAHAKAWGAVAMGMSSRALGGIAAERPAFMHALTAMADGKMVPVAGGVLIKDGDGRLLGAIGVSGDMSNRDEACAIAGIHSAGLQADPAAAI